MAGFFRIPLKPDVFALRSGRGRISLASGTLNTSSGSTSADVGGGSAVATDGSGVMSKRGIWNSSGGASVQRTFFLSFLGDFLLAWTLRFGVPPPPTLNLRG